MRRTTILAALLLLATACAGGDGPAPAVKGSAATASDGIGRARAAAAVANAMAANPAAADSILRAAGYTTNSFERLMYEIAADSAQAAAYAAVRAN